MVLGQFETSKGDCDSRLLLGARAAERETLTIGESSERILFVMLLPRTTAIFLLQLALSAAVFLAGDDHASAQTKDPSPTPSPEKREKEEPEEDRIYWVKEVDVRAKVIRVLADPPKPGTDCPGRMRLLVSVIAVLRKSGKVTDAELVRDSGCSSYDTDAIRAVQNVKFSPALKDNRPVSQYQRFEYQYTRF